MGYMSVRQSETEEGLFRPCTAITMGNGHSVKFWHDKGLQG
jgi:hypothetical protein